MQTCSDFAGCLAKRFIEAVANGIEVMGRIRGLFFKSGANPMLLDLIFKYGESGAVPSALTCVIDC